MKNEICAIITAAGSGTRMGGSIAKQYLTLCGKPILQLTCEKFQKHPQIDSIIIVLPPSDCKAYAEIIQEWKVTKLHKIVPGDSERHLSVWQGIQALPNDAEIVLIHDGVRPLIANDVITKSILAAQEYGAAVVAVPPKDTVKEVNGGVSVNTLNRSGLALAQTPQTFTKSVIRDAFEYAFAHHAFSTDDAALVEQIGRRVQLVWGDARNIKITTPEDLKVAELFIEQDE